MAGWARLDLHMKAAGAGGDQKMAPSIFASLSADIVQMHLGVFVLHQEALTLIDKNIHYLMTLHQ